MGPPCPRLLSGGIRLDAQPIVHGMPQLLLAPEVALCRLYRDVAEEKLDLLQFAAGRSAQASAASVRYQVSALASHDATVSAREKVEIFGIYLVNFAYAVDAITQTEADRLLGLWNGKKRSV